MEKKIATTIYVVKFSPENLAVWARRGKKPKREMPNLTVFASAKIQAWAVFIDKPPIPLTLIIGTLPKNAPTSGKPHMAKGAQGNTGEPHNGLLPSFPDCGNACVSTYWFLAGKNGIYYTGSI